MIRQRIHLRTPALAYLTRALTVLLAAILVWYGGMLVLLAAKVAPHTVESLSGYRAVYDWLASLKESDFSTVRRALLGVGGLSACLVFVFLALQELPRPYLARHSRTLSRDGQGSLSIEPRAIERLAEIAAAGNSDVGARGARLQGEGSLTLSIGVHSARSAADTLTDVRERVLAALEQHQLPALVVNVTLARFEPTTGRNLR